MARSSLWKKTLHALKIYCCRLEVIIVYDVKIQTEFNENKEYYQCSTDSSVFLNIHLSWLDIVIHYIGLVSCMHGLTMFDLS